MKPNRIHSAVFPHHRHIDHCKRTIINALTSSTVSWAPNLFRPWPRIFLVSTNNIFFLRTLNLRYLSIYLSCLWIVQTTFSNKQYLYIFHLSRNSSRPPSCDDWRSLFSQQSWVGASATGSGWVGGGKDKYIVWYFSWTPLLENLDCWMELLCGNVVYILLQRKCYGKYIYVVRGYSCVYNYYLYMGVSAMSTLKFLILIGVPFAMKF